MGEGCLRRCRVVEIILQLMYGRGEVDDLYLQMGDLAQMDVHIEGIFVLLVSPSILVNPSP